MGLKQCDKCSEMVDEAKAFCPGCGNAFVEEEKRQQASEFDRMDSTVQLGQTMYNQMLSDMGLNISQKPQSVEKRVEVIVPLPVAAKPPAAVKEKPKASIDRRWIILGAAVLVVIFLLLLAAITLIVLFWPRLTEIFKSL